MHTLRNDLVTGLNVKLLLLTTSLNHAAKLASNQTQLFQKINLLRRLLNHHQALL